MLTAALVVVVFVVGDDGVFSSDEGAGLSQMAVVADGSWGVSHPMPEVDPDGAWFPLEKAGIAVDGGYAPLPKKPVYTWLGGVVWGLGGARAVMVLSAVGSGAAALMAGLLARELGAGRLDRATLWLTGLASPLLADGLIVIAHTLAAAALALAAVAVLRWRGRASGWWIPVIVLAALLSVLLRSEAVLLVIAMAGAAAALASWRRDARLGAAAVLLAVGCAIGMAVDLALTKHLFDQASVVAPATSTAKGMGGSFADDRVTAFVTTWLRPGYGTVGVAQLLGILVVLVGLVLVVRSRRGAGPTEIAVLCLAVAGLAVARLLVRAPDPDVVPGLLPAFPFIVWGLGALRRVDLASHAAAWCCSSAAIFALGVLGTQYREGGAWEWGGRYFAVGLPVVAPLVVVGGARVLAGFEERRRWIGVASVAATALSIAGLQVLAVRSSHVLSDDLVQGALAAASRTTAGDGRPSVIVSTEPELPRTAWAQLDEARWLYVPLDELPEVLRALHRTGIGQIALATLAGPGAVKAAPRLREQLAGPPPPEGVWWFTPLEVG